MVNDTAHFGEQGSKRTSAPVQMPTIRAPYTVHSVVGYGRTAWQVRDGGGRIIGRLVSKANADEVARLLNAGSGA